MSIRSRSNRYHFWVEKPTKKFYGGLWLEQRNSSSTLQIYSIRYILKSYHSPYVMSELFSMDSDDFNKIIRKGVWSRFEQTQVRGFIWVREGVDPRRTVTGTGRPYERAKVVRAQAYWTFWSKTAWTRTFGEWMRCGTSGEVGLIQLWGYLQSQRRRNTNIKRKIRCSGDILWEEYVEESRGVGVDRTREMVTRWR